MKRLLLDQGLPLSTAKLLRDSGIAAQHAAEVELSRASDTEILDYARLHNLIIVTLDADFHMLLAISGASSPSVIRLRQERLNSEQAKTIIVAVVNRAAEALEAGAVVSVTSSLIRVKLLPLPSPSSRGRNT